ncbi:conserved hypothetical mosaic CUP0956/HP1116/jhp1044-like protein [Helicobacter cinaedi]|uniref:Conserved hypothetical mosaic CUP0956/HP1116/jhp1044-like protein n=1 Tax=Helicobacter cinaedi TaxID=213 RepID=A0A377JV25_9HELI|nr:hypothetical protein [Helicobacter cinaedi]STP11042.1 conserved hypothetical mosaic CUP0956/HP1116/jhp1044-like protein [Helicobacter cinaedi]
MWKQKGQLNKEVLLSHSQRPNTSPSLNLERPMPSNTIADSTTNNQTFKVQPQEIDDFQKHFNFKNKKPLLRELRENEITHALKSHGDEIKETQRGNIAITRADIEANYPRITQEYDERFFTNRSVIYVKQVNGYHIGIEEALLGQDKLIFKSLWKTKGNYNREVLLKNAKANPYPHNADEVAKSESISNPSLEQGYPQQYHLSTPNSTTNKVFNQGDIKFDIDSYANTDEFKAFNQIKNAEKAKDIIPQPNKQTFQAYKQSLESQGIPIENEVKSFINFVEKNIYNENGVSFNQLNNALKTLNSYYKEAKDPNFKNHIKNAMDSFLREDIKAGIEAIFHKIRVPIKI